MRKRDHKTLDKKADDKSVLSGLTAKTTGGKGVDKHCLDCDKRISACNWGKHVVRVHNSLTPKFSRITSNQCKY